MSERLMCSLQLLLCVSSPSVLSKSDSPVFLKSNFCFCVLFAGSREERSCFCRFLFENIKRTRLVFAGVFSKKSGGFGDVSEKSWLTDVSKYLGLPAFKKLFAGASKKSWVCLCFFERGGFFGMFGTRFADF